MFEKNDLMPHWGRKDTFHVQGEAQAKQKQDSAAVDDYTFTFAVLQHIGTAGSYTRLHFPRLPRRPRRRRNDLARRCGYSAVGPPRCAGP